MQLLFGLLTYGGFDRLLSGPTNEVWLTPWIASLKQRGVELQSGVSITGFNVARSSITSVAAQTGAEAREITADYYISALPIEVMTPLVGDALKAAAPSLANLAKLRTAWMNGIQFYLAQDVPLEFGHTLYADSPWALTSISQRQFWGTNALAGFGDGQTGGILSVDTSDWETPGIVFGKTATQCSPEEIKTEVWQQIKVHVNVMGTEIIQDDNLRSWFLDPDVQFPNPSGATNLEPLMINTSDSLEFRPDASTEISNFFLSSDYVKTFTDVACMEAANEAARRAVNALLDRAGSTAPRASIWPLQGPDFFAPMIEYDRLRFRLGLPNAGGVHRQEHLPPVTGS